MSARAIASAAAIVAALVAPAASQADDARYALAGGCYALRAAAGPFVVKSADGSYRASAEQASTARPFRMKATALGHYFFFGRDRDFMAVDGQGAVATTTTPGPAADWIVGDGFTIRSGDGRALTTAPDGRLALGEKPALFSFEPADGCATFPEAETNAAGTPFKGRTPYAEVRGLLDAHVHGTGFEAFGGAAHCGRPWSPWGITVALGTCDDPTPAQHGVESVVQGDPTRTQDPVGWPTFKDWPGYDVPLHEGTYYKWIERAWRGGLRLYQNLFNDNHALCVIYPVKRHGCNEMDSIRLQAKDMYALQDYIDAQSGGPGKGFLRIVTDPFQARRVINAGKLAVVFGIETSQPLDCTVHNDVPDCDRAQIDRELDEVYALGVRNMLLVNKFDNALGGVAGDGGTNGDIVNGANWIETGKFWQFQTCQGPKEEYDSNYDRPLGSGGDAFGELLQPLLPAGAAPIYPAPPYCNTRPLTALGEHLVRRMMQKRMIIDPDHLDVISRQALLSILEATDYSGVISSHSWSTPDAYRRIFRLGGVVTPYAGGATGFVKNWATLRAERDPRFYFGFGFGSDIHGLGYLGGPRKGQNPVSYPFKSFDGAVTLEREKTGQRTWDINDDGVAQYGLYPDWVEDLRKLAGDQIIREMARGAEAYLQMWERAVGVPATRCLGRARLRRNRLGPVKLGADPDSVLLAAGQPAKRSGRVFRWCAPGRGRVSAVFTSRGRVGLIAVKPRGKGGRTRYVASRSVRSSSRRLRQYLRLAGAR